jgi:hypothetical protein
MKTWYLLAAAVAYYLYSQSPTQQLAAAQAAASPTVAGNQVAPINVSDALMLATTTTPAYVIPTVTYNANTLSGTGD